jgi:hypothetical protein
MKEEDRRPEGGLNLTSDLEDPKGMKNPVYKCDKCGWKGEATNAMMAMHPTPEEGPRCPKCFNVLTKVPEESCES